MASKYEKIAEQLRERLIGEHPAGYKLPTESFLCEKYNVSRQTVRRALLLLEEEGLIVRRQGSGSYAADVKEADTKRIVLLFYSATEYIYPSLISDIERNLNADGFTIEVMVTDGRVETERHILQSLLRDTPEGIITDCVQNGRPTPNRELYEYIQDRGCPILYLNGGYTNLPGTPVLNQDDFQGGYYLGKYLAGLGHTWIGGIFGRDQLCGINRYMGLMEALKKERLSMADEQIVWYDIEMLRRLHREKDCSFLEEAVHGLIGSCTGIVCQDDEIGYWLIRILMANGKKVPEDISVVSFNNSYLSELSAVPITTLSHKTHELGVAAAEGIRRLLLGKRLENDNILWHMVEKNSCKSPRSR